MCLVNIWEFLLPPSPLLCVQRTHWCLFVCRDNLPIKLLMSDNHQEELSIVIMKSLHVPLVLWCPWLRKHNPHVDWNWGNITGWSCSCYATCLQSATCPSQSPPSLNVVPPDLSSVPAIDHDLGNVFSLPIAPTHCMIELPGGSGIRCQWVTRLMLLLQVRDMLPYIYWLVGSCGTA